MSPVHAALAAITYLLVKHAVADFILQTDLIFRQKGSYGAPGGLWHALIHILLTAPVFLLFPGGAPGLAAALLAGEFALHYHIDWTKEQIVRRENWTPKDKYFWWAFDWTLLDFDARLPHQNRPENGRHPLEEVNERRTGP